MYKVMIIGHLLGDFFFQKQIEEKDKRKKAKMIYNRLCYYMVLLLVGICFTEVERWGEIALSLLAVCIIYVIIKNLKIRLIEKYEKLNMKIHILFLMEHILNVCCLCIMVTMGNYQIADNCLAFSIFDEKIIKGLIAPILAMLICWKPSSTFISTVFRTLPKTMDVADISVNKVDNKYLISAEKEEGARIGSWIGILEREIILILGLLGQFGAIGFVLTAKSLARFKQLENKAFAEKYLVGTLISSGIALLSVLVCR